MGISDIFTLFFIDVFNGKELGSTKIPSRTSGNSGLLLYLLWQMTEVAAIVRKEVQLRIDPKYGA